MEYKKIDAAKYRPTGKQNCICWLDTGEKVTAYYHYKNKQFVGMYSQTTGDYWHGKELPVKEWCYAILQKRHSNDLFPNMVDQMGLTNGLEAFRTEYSILPDLQQQRLFNEVEMIRAAIINSLEKNEKDK